MRIKFCPKVHGPNGVGGGIVLTVKRGVVTVPVEVSRGFRMGRHRRPGARVARAFYIAFDTSAVQMANDNDKIRPWCLILLDPVVTL